MQVKCPSCHHSFDAKRMPNGTGAGYVREWRHLPQRCKEIICVWISQINEPKTKDVAYQVCTKAGLKTSPGAFYARISELVGLGILESDGERRAQGSHQTEIAPQYTLNLEKAAYVLNRGGVLQHGK